MTMNNLYGYNLTLCRNNGASGNFFDDFIDHDKNNDNKIDEDYGSYTEELGLAAGLQSKTDVYSDVAIVISGILFIMSICFFIMYKKRVRNHY